MYAIEKVWKYENKDRKVEIIYGYDCEAEEKLITLKSWQIKDAFVGEKNSTTETDEYELIQYLVYLYWDSNIFFGENKTQVEELFNALNVSYELLWELGIPLVPILTESILVFKLPDGQKIWQHRNWFFLEQLNNQVMWLPDGYSELLNEIPRDFYVSKDFG